MVVVSSDALIASIARFKGEISQARYSSYKGANQVAECQVLKSQEREVHGINIVSSRYLG